MPSYLGIPRQTDGGGEVKISPTLSGLTNLISPCLPRLLAFSGMSVIVSNLSYTSLLYCLLYLVTAGIAVDRNSSQKKQREFCICVVIPPEARSEISGYWKLAFLSLDSEIDHVNV